MSAPKKISDLSDSERLEAYSRLFRFTTEEDIDTKDFAEKTGMSVNSVNSMIRHAKQNAKLYEEMVAEGYSDGEFPVWWYSPAREGTTAKTVEQPRTTPKEGEQIEGRRTETKEGEGYEPTPPDTPAPKEGRPALPASSLRSDTIRSDAPLSGVVPPPSTSSSFSEAELSLLKDRAITEITLGQWMHTAEQADSRIILTPVDPRRELLTLKRAAQGDRIMGARVRNGTIPLFTRLQSWAHVNPSNSSGIPRRILDTWAFPCFHPEDDTWLGMRARPYE